MDSTVHRDHHLAAHLKPKTFLATFARLTLHELASAFGPARGPVAVKDARAVQRDIQTLLESRTGRGTELVMSSVSPGQIARFMGTAY